MFTVLTKLWMRTMQFGGDVVAHRNTLRDAIFDFCKRTQNWKLVLVWVMKGGLQGSVQIF